MTITTKTVEPGIVSVTVNYPPVNAIPSAGWFELADAITAAGRDKSTHVVILRAEGRGFNAGVDIKEMQNTEGYGALIGANRGCYAAFAAVYECAVPVIAAVNGFALGGGCEIALSCHIRVASDGARFGQPEVKIGLLPGFGGSQRLPRLIGKGRALELLLTGGMIDAGEALRIGLVNKVVPAESLVETAMDIAGVIAANAPLAIEYCMAAVSSGLEMPLEEALRMEAALFGLCFASDDMREGTSAFLEKRPARFTGR